MTQVSAEASLDDIVTQLKILNRLFIAQIKASMTQGDIISLLETTGATNKEIAEVLNTTTKTVTNTLSQRRVRRRSATND